MLSFPRGLHFKLARLVANSFLSLLLELSENGRESLGALLPVAEMKHREYHRAEDDTVVPKRVQALGFEVLGEKLDTQPGGHPGEYEADTGVKTDIRGA